MALQDDRHRKLEQLLEQAADQHRQRIEKTARSKEEQHATLLSSRQFMSPGECFTVVVPPKGDNAVAHAHDYIEMNFVWRGSFRQIIEGKEVISSEGDVCLLDTQAVHSVEDLTGEGLLINIIMEKAFLDTAFLTRISNQGSVAEFLVAAVQKSRRKEHYLYFNSHTNSRVLQTMVDMLLDYYERNIGYEEVFHSYMVILFTELLRTVRSDAQEYQEKDQLQILNILSYIEKEYASCTLKDAAHTCGLNPNYLTTLLKKKTGLSFLEHIQRKKMTKAKYYLENTDISVEQIAQLCGYQNLNFFYKLFEKETGCTPARYRKNKN